MFDTSANILPGFPSHFLPQGIPIPMPPQLYQQNLYSHQPNPINTIQQNTTNHHQYNMTPPGTNSIVPFFLQLPSAQSPITPSRVNHVQNQARIPTTSPRHNTPKISNPYK